MERDFKWRVILNTGDPLNGGSYSAENSKNSPFSIWPIKLKGRIIFTEHAVFDDVIKQQPIDIYMCIYLHNL